MGEPANVLYCDCAYAKVIPPEVRHAVLERLSASGMAFDAVPDLCGMSARKDPALKRIAESGDVRIAACFPRAIRWLFHAADAPLPDEGVTLLNMRRRSADEIMSQLLPEDRPQPSSTVASGPDASPPAEVQRARVETAADTPGAWIPWFPVIDFDRCTNCMQCLSFCLFGVFGVDEQRRISVRNPDRCKNGCPACSRVCPDVAIIFPKYEKGPINGDAVREADMRREGMKVDVSALLGGDTYASLRARNAKARERFSTERDESRALQERKRCLRALGADLDIPDEVLMRLPDADELEKRARRAETNSFGDQGRAHAAGDRRSASQEEWDI